MTQLKTHLLAEDPSIVLIGEDSVLRSQMIKMLQSQNLQVLTFDPEEILKKSLNLGQFKNAYKTIWIYEQNGKYSDDYLELIGAIKDLDVSITIVATVFAKLTNFGSDLFSIWKEKSSKQTQFIVDCNYHLEKVSFIFGQDILFSKDSASTLDFVIQNIQKGVLADPGISLGLLDSADFVENIKDYLFKPGQQSSVLITGQEFESGQVIGSLKKLYDSYHNTNLEIIKDSVEIGGSVPFSVQKKNIASDINEIITKLVKIINPPLDLDTRTDVVRPTKKSPEEDKNIEYKQSPSQESPRAQVFEEALREKVAIFNPKKVVSEKVDVDDEIQRIFKSSRTDFKVERIREIAKNTKKISKKSGRRKLLFLGGIGVAGAAIGVILLALVFFLSQYFLKKELLAFISRGIVSQDTVFIEDEGLKKLTSFVRVQVNGYGSIIETNLIADASSMVEISEGLQSIPQLLLEVDEASKNLVLQILGGDNNKTSELAQILDDKAQLAYENLSVIQASFNLIDFDFNSEEKTRILSDYEEKLNKIRSGISTQQQLQPILASLTGELSKKTYAVILQNNQELRPTGGFIQAVALLNFDNGSLVSQNIYSVYDLDAKLSGTIVPPIDIINYLGEKRWFLRDSNWNPDFPATSKQIGWFLNKILGTDIDGVIALNLFSIGDLLEVTGPIDLPEYNEVVNHKNLSERMEFHSEVVLVDSPDSIDYSVKIFEKTLEKITKINRDKIPLLLSSLEKSIKDNQLSMSVNEKSDQSVLHSLGWTGGLTKPSCPSQLSLVDCKVDVFFQVEANIGINKANYYLDRSISHKVAVDREKAVHKRVVAFKNNAKSNSWPKGTYSSFQRFYIDKNAAIDRVLINGSALIDEQISQKETGDFLEVGFRVDVPIQKEVIVELSYFTSHSYDRGFSYVFFNKKQAGTSNDPLLVSIEYSNNIEPVLIAPAAEVVDRTIIFDVNSNSSLYSVEFE